MLCLKVVVSTSAKTTTFKTTIFEFWNYSEQSVTNGLNREEKVIAYFMSASYKITYARVGSKFFCVLGLCALLLVQGNDWLNASMTPFSAKLRHTLYPNEWGVAHPAGLAYIDSSGYLLVLDKHNINAPYTMLTLFTPYEELVDKVQIPFPIDNAINIAFDGTGRQLLLVNGRQSMLAQIGLDEHDRPVPATLQQTDIAQLQIANPQGMATDQSTQHLLILDSDMQRIVILDLSALPAAAHQIGSIDLAALGAATLQGLALHPTTRHLLIGDPGKNLLYEITQTGERVASYAIDELDLVDPQGFVFAPSADLTDPATTFHLFTADSYLVAQAATSNVADLVYLPLISMQSASKSICSIIANPSAADHLATTQRLEAAADSGQPRLGQIVEVMLDSSAHAITANAAPPLVLSLVRTTDTAAFSPPSPDPSGIAYIPTLNQLLIADGEVDELPATFTGDNLYAATLSGILQRTGTLFSYTNEPTGLAYNITNGHLFISDDDQREIFEVVAGSDGLYGTNDDLVTSFDTTVFDSLDPEDVTFNANTGELFIVDGINAEVYIVNPGPNGSFDGIPAAGGDDVVTNFDLLSLIILNPEGIYYDTNSDHLFLVGNNQQRIYEITIDGTLVQLYDTTAAALIESGGITLAPGSINSNNFNFYIVDRGIDNDIDPTENDGRLHELTLGGDLLPTNTPTPQVTATPTAIVTTPPTVTPTSTPSVALKSVALFVDQDTWLQESDPNQNHGKAEILSANTQLSDSKRAVYRFDLAPLPTAAAVTQATVYFWIEEHSTQSIALHRVTNAWTESRATWNNNATNFAGTAEGSFIPNQKHQYIGLDITALARQWATGAVANNGVMLIASLDQQATFGSHERKNQNEWPCMVVSYE